MKKGGILNARLAYSLARLGHTDLLAVCDAGLPIPSGPEVVDLAFRFGVPSFEDVLSGLLEELVVDGATAAVEVKVHNPTSYELRTMSSSRAESYVKVLKDRIYHAPDLRGPG